VDAHEGPTIQSSCYIPPDIRGEEVVIKDGSNLGQSLRDVCDSLKRVFNTKVHPTPALVTPMRLEVDEKIWNARANTAARRQHSTPMHDNLFAQPDRKLHTFVPKKLASSACAVPSDQKWDRIDS
jgi:hypothetical protein